MKVKCLNCGEEFELENIYKDDMGTFTVCPECEGSFDVDIDYSKYKVINGKIMSK